jgi:putative FmdB family regulatory protein
MPTYLYRCENCGEELEVEQGMNDKKLHKCPNCKKKKLERVPSLSNVHFKGDGFTKSSR